MKKIDFNTLTMSTLTFMTFGIGLIVGISLRNVETTNLYEKLNAYRTYYNGAEELLDTLANDNNWPDRFDIQSYYDGVYELKNVGE